MADAHRVAPRAEWLAARRALMEREKALTRERDASPAARRELPWLRVEKGYVFEGPDGKESLADLFAGRSQLIVYHFMFAPTGSTRARAARSGRTATTESSRTSRARDVTLVAVSISPSAARGVPAAHGLALQVGVVAGSDFNRDFGVSFTPDEIAGKAKRYNFETQPFQVSEAPGASVFARDERGDVFLSYACFARGLEPSILPISCWISYPRAGTRRVCPIPWSGCGTATRTRNSGLLRKPCARQAPDDAHSGKSTGGVARHGPMPTAPNSDPGDVARSRSRPEDHTERWSTVYSRNDRISGAS